MPYNSQITRSDADSLIPDETSREIIQMVPSQSVVLTLGKKLANMSAKQRKVPVLDALAYAYFVSGDTGLKQTTEISWKDRFLVAEEIAVIVPIPEAVLADASYDVWGEVKPRLVEAFGKKIDQAIIHGTDIPAEWATNMGNHDGLLDGCVDASQTVDLSTQLAAGKDLFDIIMGEGGLLSLVEEDGYAVNGHVAAMSFKSKVRGLRSKIYDGTGLVAQGDPIFQRSLNDKTRWDLDGEPIYFPTNGCVAAASLLDLCGDWSQLVYSMRQDVTYKLLDQAVITDASNAIIYNLAQQDMVALRATMRIAFALPNPVNAMNATEATRWPFAALIP